MEKLYLTKGEVVDRIENYLRLLPLGFAYGIDFFTNGSHPPYLKIWFDDVEDGECNQWVIEDSQCDAENVLKVLNEVSERVNTICNAVDIYAEQPHYYDDEMPF